MFSFEDDCNMSEQECEMFSLADECKPFETCSHVRAVTAEQMEIVLDSGADVSALPLRFGTIGKSCPQPRDGAFVDAQGGKLNVRDVRIGKVQLGAVSFRERFIIADVTTPLLALGSIVRAGWSLHADGTHQFLCKGDKTVEVLFKRNSLCAMGTISQISETDGEAVSPVASPCNAFERGDTRVFDASAGICQANLRPGQCDHLEAFFDQLGPWMEHVDTSVVCHFNFRTTAHQHDFDTKQRVDVASYNTCKA